MIQVLCSESELQEYVEVVQVGQRVTRMGARRDWTYFGSDLDDVPWQFDQYAVAGHSVTLTGDVVEIAAVYVRAAHDPSGGWTAEPGSAWLEPLTTTADTRQPEQEVLWGPPSIPDEEGNYYRSGTHVIHAGDELFSGWLFTLVDEEIRET